MPVNPAIALIVFSNDLDNFLPNVELEKRLIEEALEHYDDTNRLKVITRSSVSIEDIFRLFSRYKDRITLFHFAGHAGGKGLQLNDNFRNATLGRAEGLAALLGREATEGQLKFVFLNGCSTAPQVQALKKAGVPSIIGTNYPISDHKAVRLARQFYRTLSNAEQANPFETENPTIQATFESSIQYLKTGYSLKIHEKQSRGFSFDLEEVEQEEPWELFTTTPEWKLPNEAAAEDKTFNEFLTRRLIEAIEPYSRPAQRFLPKANKKAPDWETQTRISDTAKDIIVYSYVGLIGIQLRKLIAIGKEDMSKTKQRRYLDTCLYTAKRSLKIISFTLISKLWDYKSTGKAQPYQLSTTQHDAIQRFFEDDFGLDIKGYLTLFQELYTVFKDNQLVFPIEELKDFEPQLKPKSAFTTACLKLHGLQQVLDKTKFQIADCFTAERQVTTLLEQLNFFARYKMISIKNITYDEMRNVKPRYIHQFAALGIDSKSKINSERIKYEETPINTDAILFYKGRYQDSLNLFPFIIDLNALKSEGGSKICFYDAKDMSDGSLNYRFLEDNAIENIVFQDIQAKETDINTLISDLDKRDTVKLDMAFTQFQAAKVAILGATETEEEDDFGDFMDDDDEW